jgi:hypothetical protein
MGPFPGNILGKGVKIMSSFLMIKLCAHGEHVPSTKHAKQCLPNVCRVPVTPNKLFTVMRHDGTVMRHDGAVTLPAPTERSSMTLTDFVSRVWILSDFVHEQCLPCTHSLK